MYNNPYNFYPYMNNMAMNSGMMGASMMGARNVARPGLFRSLSNIKWGNVLTNTQKTLNVINQAIPVYYQIKPIWQNVKSFSRIMTAFNEPDKPNNISNNQEVKTEKKEVSQNSPTFFIN